MNPQKIHVQVTSCDIQNQDGRRVMRNEVDWIVSFP